MAYPTSAKFDLTAVDRDMLAYWEQHNIFQRTIDERPEADSFVFYEGPPSANGMPGIHHVMARTVKDLFCRYQTLKGKRVERRGGWDTHGLPIEINVEKELGITKEDIGKTISVADYNAKCRETVMRFKDVWDDITRRMAYWVDLDRPYVTFENDYIESVWHLLGQLYDKDYLYKGYTIQPYSPAAGTGLSSHELNLPGCYKEVSDTSITAQFKVIRDEKSAPLFEGHEASVYILAWTTTPWTLPANCALAIGKKIDYVVVETFNPYTKAPLCVVLAEDRLSAYIDPASLEADFAEYDRTQKKPPARIINRLKGSDLIDIRYEQLMPYVQPSPDQPGPDGEAFRVIAADFVTTADGSGIVHTASVFGADDYRACLANNVPSILVQRGKEWIPVVDRQGRFVDEITDFAGHYVRQEYYSAEAQAEDGFESTDIQIAVLLKKTNRAFKVEKYIHNYPHCWRTDKPVLYYPLDSWFVRASAARERMAELNKTINWKPAHTGTKRFQVWLENLLDWNLSRSRYWGIPLPMWRTEDGEEEVCISSYEQLFHEIKKANEAFGLDQVLPEDVHKPYIDEIVLVAPSGKEMRRESDLIDVWFDSGSMPYAQHHYPFENQDVFARNFPADFIAEGVDQTRGWFYSLHAIAVMTRDSVAYKNVVSNGLVLDADGQKMSKSKGNVVDPFYILDTYGIDATRWYMMTNANPWDNLRFDEKGIEEIRRKFFGTLYNTYAFFALYANLDGFQYAEADIPHADRPEIDRWILAQLHQLIGDVDHAYASYEPTQAGRMIQAFTEDLLSNWYVRLNRRRFWKGDYEADKISAYQTLHTCLTTIARIMSPIAPSYADWLYQALTKGSQAERHDSVHLATYPAADETLIDTDLIYRMHMARKVSSLTLSLRKKHRLRVRQPLQRIIMPAISPQFEQAIDLIGDIIRSEVNVKTIDLLPDDGSLFKKRGKPNFKTLGRRLGKDMKAAQQAITAMTADEIDQLLTTNTYELTIEDRNYTLTTEDIETYIENIPGWEVVSDDQLVVALDTTLTDELIHEGVAKEIIHGIQNLRKDNGLDVTDRITVHLQDSALAQSAVAAHASMILEEVLGDGIDFEHDFAGHEVTLADGQVIMVGIEKVDH